MQKGIFPRRHRKNTLLTTVALCTLGATPLVLGLNLLAPTPAWANGCETRWQGGIGTELDWNDGGNWDDDVPTQNCDTAVINNGGTAGISAGGATAGELSLGSGFMASGNLRINAGGGLTTDFAHIASGPSSSGVAYVTGNGASWASQQINVGSQGVGFLFVSDGGSITDFGDGLAGIFLGGAAGSMGQMSVSGATSSVTVDNLMIGLGGSGSALTISDGAVVTVGTFTVANTGAIATLNIGAANGSPAAAAGIVSATTFQFGFASMGTVVFNHTSDDYTFAPEIRGSGTLRLLAGTTRFSGGTNGYNSTMVVDGGTLALDPGQALQLLTYTQEADGVLRIGVGNDTTFGRIDVQGTATLPNNANIDIDVTNPDFNFTTAVTNGMAGIITAGTLVSNGTFEVTDNSHLFSFTATLNGNSVDLAVSGGGGGGGGGTVLSSVTSQRNTSATAAATVFDRLISTFTASGSSGNADMDTVISALGTLGTGQQVSEAISQTLPLLTGGQNQAVSKALSGSNRVVQARMEGNSGLSAGEETPGDRYLWVKPFGSWATQRDRGGISGYNAATWGMVVGADWAVDEVNRLGGAFAYSRSHVEGRSSTARQGSDVDTYQLVAYGSHALTEVSELNFQADLGLSHNKGYRDIAFGGLNRTAKADYTSISAHVGSGWGRTFSLREGTAFAPSLRADYTWIRDAAYTETGAGALSLELPSRTSNELIVSADAKLTHEITAETAVSLNLGAGYDLLNERSSITSSFVGGGAAFTTRGMKLDPWLVRGGLGLTHETTGGLQLTARYDVEGRADFLNHSASLRARWAF